MSIDQLGIKIDGRLCGARLGGAGARDGRGRAGSGDTDVHYFAGGGFVRLLSRRAIRATVLSGSVSFHDFEARMC